MRRIGSDRDVEDFRAGPFSFFCNLSDRIFRVIRRILYPIGWLT